PTYRGNSQPGGGQIWAAGVLPGGQRSARRGEYPRRGAAGGPGQTELYAAPRKNCQRRTLDILGGGPSNKPQSPGTEPALHRSRRGAAAPDLDQAGPLLRVGEPWRHGHDGVAARAINDSKRKLR